ncbi:hypothetical protein QFC21_005602 [Naganishia friedmannii]|uniref:Uncharacterized protein n=1 Tax=Naganishia friedmannii TaxID=89922 RepID=A0ACC2V8P5_9TREE|nr:hypothetical protein QFC21_005602 [Naganishia friedmannii]
MAWYRKTLVLTGTLHVVTATTEQVERYVVDVPKGGSGNPAPGGMEGSKNPLPTAAEGGEGKTSRRHRDPISNQLYSQSFLTTSTAIMQTDVEPQELVQAVAALLQNKTAAVADIQRERDANLRELYRMITAVVHGDGMLDTLDDQGSRDDAEGTEGWELFKSEASLQGEGGGLRIALPDLAVIEVSSNAMEVDSEEEKQGIRQQEEAEVERRVLQDVITPPAPTVVVPTFVVPIIQTTAAATRQVYIPRSLRTDATDVGTTALTNAAAPRWINGRLNPAAYEPPLDPRIWPVAASGHATELGFGKEGKEKQDGQMTDEIVRGDPFEVLIPLEDPYAANLHPLPPVNQPLKHKHHHHRRESGKRERTRSAVDGTTTTPTVVPDNPTFGNFSFGVPPAYIQASQKRAKIELYQAQQQGQTQGKITGGKVEDDAVEEKPSVPAMTTMNPVLANPTDATTALALPPPPPLTSTLIAAAATEHEPRGTIINPIPSSTLAPATRALSAAGTGKGMDLVELGVGFKANPLSRMMKKTNKCLTSRDWQTAYEEMKYTRAMERIEQLKHDNQWSFRQMRRFKGPTVAKVHWDYVLDEMRWLATDFKEERRWKLAAAYEIAGWCRDWYHASEEEKAAMSVGGRKWGAPRSLSQQVVAEDEGKMLVDGFAEGQEQVDQIVADMKEREEEIASVEKELASGKPGIATNDPIKPDAAGSNGRTEAQKADTAVPDDADADADGDAEGEDDDGEDAVGEVDMEDVYPDAQAGPQAMDVDSAAEASNQQAGIKAGGVGSHTLVESNDEELEQQQQRRAEFEALVPMIRKPILDVDRTTLGVDIKTILESSIDDDVDIPENVGLDDIFPDLAVFGPLTTPVAGKVEKRLDESSGRLAHVSRLFDIRPIMLTSLNPSRNRAPDGRWMDANGPLYDLADDLNEPSQEELQHSSDIFRAHKSKTGGSDGKIVEPDAPKYPDQRLAALVWEDQDDEVLLRAAKDYDYNWRLVADVVNSARVYVSTEKRTPWDCFDRWAVKIGYPSKRSQAVAAANAAAAVASNAASSSQIPGEQSLSASAATMATPSLKPALPTGQPMNPSITGLKAEDMQVDSPVSPGGSIRKDQSHPKVAKTTKYEGSKKKVRMTVLRDSIRRIQKRREANKAKQNVGRAVVIVHESHLPYLEKRGVLSPQELGEMAYQQMLQRAEQTRQMQQQQARLRQLSAAQAQQGPPGNAQVPGQAQPIRPLAPPINPGNNAQQLAFNQAQQNLMAQALQQQTQQQQQQQQQQQNGGGGGMQRPPMNQNLVALQNAHRAGLGQPNMRLQMPLNNASQSPASHPAQVQNIGNMVRPPGMQPLPRANTPGQGVQRLGSAAGSNPTQSTSGRPLMNANNAALSSSVGQHLMNLMREAGINSMSQVPIPEHPTGGQWSQEQVKRYRLEQLQVSTGGGSWANPALNNATNNANNNAAPTNMNAPS